MKRPSFFFTVFSCFIFFSAVCSGQSYIISAYAGSGTSGYTGDGGPALLAAMSPAGRMAIDGSGNIYFTDTHDVVRKINASGIISTIAGTGVAGYSGDGGPATAAQLNTPQGIATDAAGNIYIADEFNHVVRKINTAGIITTIAGNGTYGYAGDGGPATAAQLGYPGQITVDKKNNIYVSDANKPIVRKIDVSGIITGMAGTGTAGFSGDGGPATAAEINYIMGMTVDGIGNVYLSDASNFRIRKIDTTGIITTFAGNGISGFSGDGGMVALAEVNNTKGMVFDLAGNMFIADQMNFRLREVNTMGIITTVAGDGTNSSTGDGGPAALATMAASECVFDAHHNMYVLDGAGDRIRKISFGPNVVADSFSIFINNLCDGVQLTTVANDASSSSLHTWFGDGSQQTDTFTTGMSGARYVNVTHTYPAAGKYTIKEVLMHGTAAVDSAHFSYEYLLCQSFALKFYHDANGNCIKDSAENYLNLPFSIEVDSNGVAVDTIAATSGLYYTAYGSAGDVYSFKVLSCPAGLLTTCIPGGMISDTLDSFTHNIITNYIGFSCSSVTGFDLAINTGSISGRHMRIGDIITYNNYCTPENAVVTLSFSPKYIFESAVPAPTTIAGNTITWDFSGVKATDLAHVIQYTLKVPGTWLTPGDTIHSNFMVTPFIGDVDTGNNNCGGNDTIKISFDPNEMSVTPSGYISSGTQLQYTIQFENTGNDTAFNISVYDTLSDNVDVNSLRIIAASAEMNTVMLHYGGHNIVKFDFPGINLLDSSHHNLCNGMVMFNINTKAGLADSTTIFNHAGIFFDDNAVVMTDTVENIIGISTTGILVPGNTLILSVFPNPATTELTITSTENINAVSISNLMGQIVYSNSYNSSKVQVDISSLATGVYFVKVNGTEVRKFVKE